MRKDVNTLFYGDNLEILKNKIPMESIDLIYLDPPFNSNADYNILFKESSGEKSTAQIQAFSDFWQWDIEAKNAYEYLAARSYNETVAKFVQSLHDFLGRSNLLAYIVMMGTRLLWLQRVLKNTGSIYLHCDPTASHYLKLLMDAIFGVENFRSEIIWKRTHAHSGARRFGPIHDTILFYSKTDKYIWNTQFTPYSKKYIETFFRYKDENGRRYRAQNLTGSGIRGGLSGKAWKGADPTKIGRHWAIPKYIRPLLSNDPKNSHESLDEINRIGRIIWPEKEGGMPSYKQYLDDMQGVKLQDIWTDIDPISAGAKEHQGFPTQKPMSLLERIIKSSSNEGDWILDPFCGCGTAVITAEKLKRKWVGIDVTWLAINLVKARIIEMFPYSNFDIEGEPRDMGAAKELSKNRFQFQWWALSLINARPEGASLNNPRIGKKGADEGIDGRLKFFDGQEGHVKDIIIQVKSGHVGVRDIRELRDVITRNNAAIGLFLTLEKPTREMVRESKTTDPYISPILNQEYPKIQIITVEDLLKGIRPNIPATIEISQEGSFSQRNLVDNQKQQTLFK